MTATATLRFGLAAALAAAAFVPGTFARDLDSLTILGPDYPRVFYFRASETAWNTRAYPTYDSWERNFDGLMGIMGKCLEEECLGRQPRNPEFFSRFKARHPHQVVLLHFNGDSRDPLFEREAYFPGHWIYRRAVMITEDLPAEGGESTIHVADPRAFRVNAGRYRANNDEIALFGIDADGKHDWDHCEQVKLLSIDHKAGTISVQRGCYGTTPLAFRAGESRAAAHAVKGPWGPNNHFLWSYNYSTHCPRDANGKICSDLLVDDLACWFGKGGVLEAFDGIEFDVLFNVTKGDTDGDGVEDNGVIDGRNNYGIGVVEFGRKLRERMGKEFIIQADGALGHGGIRSQRNWTHFNGIESEGWPNLHDSDIEDWSGGLNRHFFWRDNAHAPSFSYINHKWKERVPDQPGRMRHVRVPFSRHRLVFAACQFFDSMICYASPPPGPERLPIWDEFIRGTDNVLGWLGRPEAPAVHLAERTPDLLGGRGQGEWLAQHVNGDVTATPGDAGVVVRPTDPEADDVAFTLKGMPAHGKHLFVSMTMKADPMTGYPREMARFVRVAASGGMIDLLVGPPDDTGMCMRGGEEEPLDRSTGATVSQRPREVDGVTLPTVFAHPPWKQTTGYTFWSKNAEIPPESELRFSVGMGKLSPEYSDGVWFKVFAAPVQDGTAGAYRKIHEVRSKAHEWLPQRVSLAEFAGQRVSLKFVADAGPADNSTNDHAHWGDVKIVREGAEPSDITRAVESMTWVNAKPFTSTFYFHHVRTDEVDLAVCVQSPEPVVIESVRVHAHPDAMFRVFEKGLVIANPSRAPYTFDLDAISPGRSYRRIQATEQQDTDTNNGEPVGNTVTLGERDALFLIGVDNDAAQGRLIIHPVPDGIEKNDDFHVQIRQGGAKWRDLFTYDAVVTDTWAEPKYHCSFVTFDFTGKVELRIHKRKDGFKSARIWPLSRKIQHTRKRDSISFTLDKPAKLSVEFDSDKYHNLLIFANAPEKEPPPNPSGPNVIYFGPGIHDLGGEYKVLGNNQIVYLAGGAVVRGCFEARGKKNITIRGRGILDGSRLWRYWGPKKDENGKPLTYKRKNLFRLINCRDISVEGIILRDAPTWHFRIMFCRDMLIRNIKEVSYFANSDGVDVISSENVTIDDVFLRCADDGVSIKTRQKPSKNILVQNSVVFTSMSRSLVVGPETDSDVSGVIFRNIDILEHRDPFREEGGAGALAVRGLGNGLITNILFEDIRIERVSEGGHLIYLRVFEEAAKKYVKHSGKGKIKNVTFRNITCMVEKPITIKGLEKGNGSIQDIYFENLYIRGKPVKRVNDARISITGSVSDVSFR